MITVSAIGLGLSFFVWLWALDEGFNQQIVDNATGYYLGHLQIAATAFRLEYDPKFSIADPARISEALKRDRRIESFTSRIEMPAFLNSAAKSTGILLSGIDPEDEAKVTAFSRKIKPGEYLGPADDQFIILGKKLAEDLGVSVGEKVVVTVSAPDGTMVQEAFRVKGLIDTGIENIDSGLACVTLAKAQNLLGLGNRVTSFIIKLKQESQIDRVEKDLKRQLGTVFFDIQSWSEIMPILISAIGFYKLMMYIILEVVFAVMATSIANTVMMSIIERTRELGVMMALGTSGFRVVKMVFCEILILGVLGIIIGNVLGSVFILVTQRTGVDLTMFISSLRDIPGAMTMVYPVVKIEDLVTPSLLLLALTVLISVFPSLRATRLKPAEAIRFV